MKIFKNIPFIIITIVCCISVLFLSCGKKKIYVPIQYGTLMFHLHTNVDVNEVDYNVTYTMSGGRNVSVSLAQLYISGIQLIKMDGSTYDVANTTILKVLDNEVYLIGKVEAGNYKSVKFKVGLDPTTNLTTPAAADSTFNQPEMWFSSAAQPDGYAFVNFEGSIDTTAAKNGPLVPFSYKLGTNANLKSVVMPDQNYTVGVNQTQYIHLIVDYAKLFTNVQLNNNNNLHIANPADNATATGIQISNNIPSMFIYE